MKIDWSRAGWRVFNDDAPPPFQFPRQVITSERIVLEGRIELVRDLETGHGWVVMADTMIGDADATQLCTNGS